MVWVLSLFILCLGLFESPGAPEARAGDGEASAEAAALSAQNVSLH